MTLQSFATPPTPSTPMTQETQETPVTTVATPLTAESTAPQRARDPARKDWRSVLIHPDDFAAIQALQKAQPQPRFDLAALVSAGLSLSLESPHAYRLIHDKAIADFKRRSD